MRATRRDFLKILGLSALGGPLAGPLAQVEGQDAGERPNIVLIVADDLGWADLSLTGSEFYQTPHIDRLAARGIFFSSNYSCGPNCAPSRGSIMTGIYTPRHGILTVNRSDRGKASERKMIPVKNKTRLDPSFVTIAERLQQAGYATCSVGKWHLGNRQAGPEGQGFDENVAGGRPGHPPSYFSPYRLPHLEDGPEGEYLTTRLTDEAVQWMDGVQDRPFFLYFPHYTVHTPIQAPDEITEKYRGKKPDGRQKNATYAAMIETLDDSVGRIVRKVEEMGQTENTVIIFISDNGGHGGVTSNEPLRGAKGTLYEGGVRVPMVVSWPGRIEAGATDDTPTTGVDLYPTLLDLAGVQPPQDVPLDGVSLARLWTQRQPLEPRSIYWHFPCYLQGSDRSNNDPHFRTRPAGAVRRGDWKLLEFFEDGRLELYNLADDIGETKNRAAQRSELAGELHEQLQAWRQSVDAKMPTPKTQDE